MAELAPALLLAALALVSIVISLNPRWRARFRWGRTSDASPISKLGCLGITLAFATMALGLGARHVRAVDDSVAFLVVLAGFVVFIGAGLGDRYASQRKRQ